MPAESFPRVLRTRPHYRIFVCLGMLVLAGFLTGCGGAVYEKRLEFTQKYYDYIDRLNRNLATQFANYGISLRVPKQFTEIPAPPPRPRPAEGAEEEDAEEPVDPRQPKFFDEPLPGLLAAWQANLTTVDGGGSTTQGKGHLYLLGNYDYWRTFKTPREIGDPLKFHEDVMNMLVDQLQIVLDERQRGTATDRVNKWFNEVVPEAADEEFVRKKEFTTITLVPEESGDDEEQPRMQYQVYLYQSGDMQIVLLYVLPRSVSAGEELDHRILLSLQTAEVSPDKPVGAAAAQGPGGAAPAGAPGGATAPPAGNSPAF
ncbi:MAG: hypothetical protein KDA78_01565 [Planctomycetaceae bacterium]|nr:hypothetical protein [Planctomycetaceae bacterium]